MHSKTPDSSLSFLLSRVQLTAGLSKLDNGEDQKSYTFEDMQRIVHNEKSVLYPSYNMSIISSDYVNKNIFHRRKR